MNTKWLGGAIVLILIVIGGWFYFSNTPSDNKETIKIGLAVGLTGYGAAWGEGEVKAVELALDDFRPKIGRPVQLIVEDTKSDGAGTVNAMQKLVNVDHVQAIIGPTWGESFEGGYPIAEEAHVTVISPSAAFEVLGTTNPYSYAFSTWWPQAQELNALVTRIKDSGAHRVYVIHDNDAFDTAFSDLLVHIAESDVYNLAIIRTSVPIGTNDFRTYLAKIKAEKPDAIFAEFQDTGSIGPLMKQLNEQNITAPVFSTASAQNEENLENFPGEFDGLSYSFPSYANDRKYAELQKALEKKYGEDAAEGPAFVNAYNAAAMLFTVLADGASTGTEIRDGLKKVHISGIGTDDLYFNDNGQIGNISFIIKTIKNNQFVEVR